MSTSQDFFVWAYQGRKFRVPLERKGVGPSVLLLPALSSISTRREMAPLRDLLAERYETLSVDWPGFGETEQPAFAWTPVAFGAYLDHLLHDIVPGLHATVAAGHAAGYLLAAAKRDPGAAGRLILVAPTWRGPLPTMMGRPSSLGAALTTIGDIPGLGQMLYRLNVNRPMVRFMAREHVYDNPSWLDARRLSAKMVVTRSPGARYAALRFVTGQLDPMKDSSDWLSVARAVEDPILLIYGVNSPRKSKAEMDALAAVPGLKTAMLPNGKLAIHEEEPGPVFDAMRSFLEGPASTEASLDGLG